MNEEGEWSQVQEKVALVLSSRDIDTLGYKILQNDASREQVIFCLEGGVRWSNEIDALLQPEVLQEYRTLSENEWIILGMPIRFCFEIAEMTDTADELRARLQEYPEEGRVLAFLLFESGMFVAVDVPIEPSRASGVCLN